MSYFTNPSYTFPFSAILGQEDFKLCLLLNLIDPSIGGVLATGDKGTGKTTTVRALSQLMGKNFPFINLPLGATEDRVLGNINLEILINKKKTIVDKGLLAKAHNGFLYIDEVNLLNDYLMDILLDACSSGGYYLEREGISQWLNSRFCLVGTMNPEEGQLRPQLTDRFGLSVQITTPKNKNIRKEIASNRLLFDSNPEEFYNSYLKVEKETEKKIENAKKKLNSIIISEEIKELVSELTLANNTEGMRADILLLKTARAYTAYLKEKTITSKAVHKIAPFVLQHRCKNYTPSNNHNNSSNQNPEGNETKQEQEKEKGDTKTSFQLPKAVKKGLQFSVKQSSKKKEVKLNKLDHLEKALFLTEKKATISPIKTVKNYVVTKKFTSIHHYKIQKSIARIIFLVDTSASMALNEQLAYIKGIIKKTIEKHPLQKIHYAIVSLENASAKITQQFTCNTSIINHKSYKLVAGGKTNLASAFFKVFELLKAIPKKTVQLFIFTDGKANTGDKNPLEHAVKTYKTYLQKLSNTTVVDTENSFVKLNKAKQLAQLLQANYIPLYSLDNK